jgi:hypothetical protein
MPDPSAWNNGLQMLTSRMNDKKELLKIAKPELLPKIR